MKVFVRLLFGLIVSSPLIFILYFYSFFWFERQEEREMTRLVKSSGIVLEDGYYCLEAKCFGTFRLGNNQRIKFFLISNIAESVMLQSEVLSSNWALASSLCNKVELDGDAEVCHLGGRVLTHKEYLDEL